MNIQNELTSNLHGIQNEVLDCLDIAADVMDSLSDIDRSSPAELQAKCEEFMNKILASQAHVAAFLKAYQPSVQHEPTAYQSMVNASIGNEKVQLIDGLLKEAQDALKGIPISGTGRDQGQRAAGSEAAPMDTN